jgi:hypothetical protein
MNTGSLLFSQVMSYVSHNDFNRCVEKYEGNKFSKSFSCYDQFLCMAFAQLTYRESLRDIETCLRSQGSKLYHLGIRGTVSRSTLAHANDNRDWRIYADLAHILIAQARQLYVDEEFAIELKNAVYALDSTTIDLCMKLFPWAKFRSTKAGIKLHTLLDLRGSIPSFISISPAKKADVTILDDLVFEAGAHYIMDRGYVDFARLYRIEQSKAFFVTRAKKRMAYRIHKSAHCLRGSPIKKDQMISLLYPKLFKKYPLQFRRIDFYDAEYERHLIFLTNNLLLDATSISLLYKARWKVELFFKWIKQHLRIKVFFGTSENAVHTQVWIAIAVYTLVAIIKKRLHSPLSLHAMFQIISINAINKIPILQAFLKDEPSDPQSKNDNQLILQGVYLGQ